MPPKATAQQQPQDATPRQLYGAPVGTPPGGGRWTWSAEQGTWVPIQPAQDNPTPEHTESPQE